MARTKASARMAKRLKAMMAEAEARLNVPAKMTERLQAKGVAHVPAGVAKVAKRFKVGRDQAEATPKAPVVREPKRRRTTEESKEDTAEDAPACKRKVVLRPGASAREFGLANSALRLNGNWQSWPVLSLFQRLDGRHEADYLDLDDGGKLKTTEIDESHVRRIKFGGEAYEDKEQKGNGAWTVEKEQVNQVVVELMRRLPRERREVVLLDGYNLRTSTHLSRAGLKRKQLHVPNPDPHFPERAGPRAQRLATVTPETLVDWVDRQDTEHEDSVATFDVLADYCCTWEGNDNVSPSLDLHAIFRKTLLAKRNGILWLTFSARTKKSEAVKAKVNRWLQEEALHFDYTLTLAYEKNYGNMVTLIYVTGRDNVQPDFTDLYDL